MGNVVRISAFRHVIADAPTCLVPAVPSTTRTLTLKLLAVVDYPVNLDLKSLEGKGFSAKFNDCRAGRYLPPLSLQRVPPSFDLRHRDRTRCD
jgi:hypothetical protein